jgi:hypothetical protein
VPKTASTPEVLQPYGSRKAAPSKKRTPYKLSEIMRKVPPISSEGYARVAWLMARADTSDLAIFRKFGELNMLNLLRLQAELAALQRQLGLLYKEEESKKWRYSFKELRKHERPCPPSPEIQNQSFPEQPQPVEKDEEQHINDSETPKMCQTPEQNFRPTEEQIPAEQNFGNGQHLEEDQRPREDQYPSKRHAFEKQEYAADGAAVDSQQTRDNQPSANHHWPSDQHSQNDEQWEDQIDRGQLRDEERLTYEEWCAIEQQRRDFEEWRANQEREAFVDQRTPSNIPVPPDIDPEDSDAGSAYRPNALHKLLKRIERKLKAYST